MPVRIVPTEEVVYHIAEKLKENDVEMPYNQVTPQVAVGLVKARAKEVNGGSNGKRTEKLFVLDKFAGDYEPEGTKFSVRKTNAINLTGEEYRKKENEWRKIMSMISRSNATVVPHVDAIRNLGA